MPIQISLPLMGQTKINVLWEHPTSWANHHPLLTPLGMFYTAEGEISFCQAKGNFSFYWPGEGKKQQKNQTLF